MNNKTNKAKRGDIFYYDFGERAGSIQSGIRPVLILQCNEGNNASPATIVAAITTAIKKRYLPTHVILGSEFGLKENSMVLLEQISTVNQCDLESYVGHIDDDELMRIINNALKKGLGLWNYAPRKNEDMHCLCGNCLGSYMDGKHIVKRMNPYNTIKDSCEICRRPGYDYLISEKRRDVQKGGATNNE